MEHQYFSRSQPSNLPHDPESGSQDKFMEWPLPEPVVQEYRPVPSATSGVMTVSTSSGCGLVLGIENLLAT